MELAWVSPEPITGVADVPVLRPYRRVYFRSTDPYTVLVQADNEGSLSITRIPGRWQCWNLLRGGVPIAQFHASRFLSWIVLLSGDRQLLHSRYTCGIGRRDEWRLPGGRDVLLWTREGRELVKIKNGVVELPGTAFLAEDGCSNCGNCSPCVHNYGSFVHRCSLLHICGDSECTPEPFSLHWRDGPEEASMLPIVLCSAFIAQLKWSRPSIVERVIQLPLLQMVAARLSTCVDIDNLPAKIRQATNKIGN